MKRNLKKQAGRLPQINVTLLPEDIKKIDLISGKLGISRSALVRNLVMMGLEDAMALNTVGVVDIMGAVRKHRQSAPERTAAARPRARTAPATG